MKMNSYNILRLARIQSVDGASANSKQKEVQRMHMNCYVCDDDNCGATFAISSLDDKGDPVCPNCCSETTDTGEVIVEPDIMGRSRAVREKRI